MNLMLKDKKGVVFLGHKTYLRYIVELIKDAETSVDLAFYKFALPGNTKKSSFLMVRLAIESAVIRGVLCRVILSRMEPDIGVSATNWATAQWLKSIGIEARYLVSRACLHTKLMIVDNDVLVIGSHNWSGNTYDVTVDASVAIHKGIAIAEASNFFEVLWSKSKPWG